MTSPEQPLTTNPTERNAGGARLPANVLALGVVSLFNDSAGDMVQPLLPAFVGTIGGGPLALGLIEGIADATASLLQLGSGYLADRIGRRKAATTAGYAVTAIARPLLALAQTWWQILGARFGDRIGKGIRTAPRDALLADATPIASRGRAYGFHRAMDNAGAIVGPAAAWLMLSSGLSMREVFAWSAVPGLLTLVILQTRVSDAAFGGSKHDASAGLPPSHAYRRLLVSIFVFTLGCSSDAFLLWRAAELGIAYSLAPILWMVLATVKSATSTWGGALSDRVGRRKVIVAGWAVYAAVYLGFALANAGWQILASVCRVRHVFRTHRGHGESNGRRSRRAAMARTGARRISCGRGRRIATRQPGVRCDLSGGRPDVRIFDRRRTRHNRLSSCCRAGRRTYASRDRDSSRTRLAAGPYTQSSIRLLLTTT